MCTWNAGPKSIEASRSSVRLITTPAHDLSLEEPSSLLAELLRSIDQGHSVAVVTVVKATGTYATALGRRALVWLDRDPLGELCLGELEAQALADATRALTQRRPKMLRYVDDQVELFVEVQRRPPTLIIVGAGHVAQPLAVLGRLIDFDVVVIDDRPQYANEERFPQANRVIAAPFRATLRDWPIDADTFIVLVTRGHSHDVDCLLEVLDSPARYIGMIGSKRRVRAVFDLLEQEQGIPREKFDRVYAPIGLDIGAESPAEIGVCIIAEIVNVYRGGRAESLSDALRANSRLPLHPTRVQTHG
jgi:xanthine dehydrogenase accessory factor